MQLDKALNMAGPSARRWVAAAALLGLLFTTAGCATKDAAAQSDAQPVPADVTTVRAVKETVPRTLALTGTLAPNRESEVAAIGAGKVVATPVERGDRVKKGALLARVDPSGAALVRAEASAQVAQARALEENAAAECQRADHLWQEQVISRSEYDRMRANCSSTRAAADAALARRRLADKALNDSVVQAPFAGLVAERVVSVGEYVQAGQTVATLVDLDALRLELTVPEAAATAVNVGQRVHFHVSALPGQTFEAELKYVGPVLRRASRDLVVEAIVENHDGKLRPGMFATAELRVGEQEAVLVPISATRKEQSSVRLFVVERGQLVERVVQLGDRYGDRVAVLRGLSGGEVVVDSPNATLRDGQQARVKTSKAPPEPRSSSR